MTERALGLIPARGGSKGVPRKNVRELAGKPLIAWTIEAALQAKSLARVVVSSEDDEILAVARAFGAHTPFVRPPELARDDTPSIEVALHALASLPERYDWLVLLQPTSPLRTGEDIDAAVQFCRTAQKDACVGVTQTRESPWWMFTRSPDGALAPLLPQAALPARRQDLPAAWSINGAVYVTRTTTLKKARTFFPPGALGFPMPAEHSVDIDTEPDFLLARALLEARAAAKS